MCDCSIENESDLCSLHVSGISEKLNAHSKCVKLFFSCKGDFTKLPNGRLKRSIQSVQQESLLILNTSIVLRIKELKHIKAGLLLSHEEGLSRIEKIATDFYGLPILKNPAEYYSIDKDARIVVMVRKKNIFKITDAARS